MYFGALMPRGGELLQTAEHPAPLSRNLESLLD